MDAFLKKCRVLVCQIMQITAIFFTSFKNLKMLALGKNLIFKEIHIPLYISSIIIFDESWV